MNHVCKIMLIKCWLIMHNTILESLITLLLPLGVIRNCKVLSATIYIYIYIYIMNIHNDFQTNLLGSFD
jgi:hypothetical protein